MVVAFYFRLHLAYFPRPVVAIFARPEQWNGYQFQLEQNELADMFIGIADGTKDETELRYWINDHIE